MNESQRSQDDSIGNFDENGVVDSGSQRGGMSEQQIKMAKEMVMEEHPLWEKRVSEVLPFFDMFLRCRRSCSRDARDDVAEEFQALSLDSPNSRLADSEDFKETTNEPKRTQDRNSEMMQTSKVSEIKTSIEQWT